MPEVNNDNSGILDNLIGQIAVAKDILKPEQLFDHAIIVVPILYLASSYAKIDVTIPSLTIIFILAIYILGWKGSTEEITKVEEITELPSDLKVKDDIFNRIKTPMEKMDFQVTQSVNGNKWGKTYYYSTAIKDSNIVGLISLDPKFFMFGDTWKKSRWLSYITKIPNTPFTHLVIFSDIKFICQEALYEMIDVKKDINTSIIILSEIYSEEIRQASTTEEQIIDMFKLHFSN